MKLNRKQKILRNCALIGLCLFLLAWMLEFPCLTKEGMLKRAERRYLLNGPTELLVDMERYMERKTLFGRNQEGLISIEYEATPLGYQIRGISLYPAVELEYFLVIDMDVGVSDGYVAQAYHARVVGLRERVARGELDLLKDGETVLRFEGEWQEPCCVVFPLYGKDAEGKDRLWTGRPGEYDALLRLYDEEGKLLTEERFNKLTQGDIFLR